MLFCPRQTGEGNRRNLTVLVMLNVANVSDCFGTACKPASTNYKA